MNFTTQSLLGIVVCPSSEHQRNLLIYAIVLANASRLKLLQKQVGARVSEVTVWYLYEFPLVSREADNPIMRHMCANLEGASSVLHEKMEELYGREIEKKHSHDKLSLMYEFAAHALRYDVQSMSYVTLHHVTKTNLHET
jgi:hypothetical protein